MCQTTYPHLEGTPRLFRKNDNVFFKIHFHEKVIRKYLNKYAAVSENYLSGKFVWIETGHKRQSLKPALLRLFICCFLSYLIKVHTSENSSKPALPICMKIFYCIIRVWVEAPLYNILKF